MSIYRLVDLESGKLEHIVIQGDVIYDDDYAIQSYLVGGEDVCAFLSELEGKKIRIDIEVIG